jgi:lipopolysaccharide export LptBFGC system permease protein LptF
MWSSLVLFILTFAVFGLLLGYAAIHDTNHEQQISEGSPTFGNETDNLTQRGQSNSSNIVANQESG